MPLVDLPSSDNTVTVKIIDNGARITGPMSFFLDHPVLDDLQSREKIYAPAFVFLIENKQSNHRVIFDLGIRRNLPEYPPAVLSYHEAFEMQTGEEVSDVLRDGGIDLDTIEAIIWR